MCREGAGTELAARVTFRTYSKAERADKKESLEVTANEKEISVIAGLLFLLAE